MSTQRLSRFAIMTLALSGAVLGCWLLLRQSSGIQTYLWLTALAAGLIVWLRTAHLLIAALMFQREPRLTGYWNLLLAALSMLFVLTGFEGWLRLRDGGNMAANERLLTMPDEWKERPVVVAGTVGAKYWHGKLHIYNEYGMRRNTPFPAKKPEFCRIIVVGDSLTYGKGVDANDTYPSVLERLLAPEFRVEILNLGISGYQSEDMLRLLWEAVPQLQPDMVVYGICLNDFLESGEGQQVQERRSGWEIPLPESAKQFLIDRTRAGQFFDKAYDDLLMRLHLRADFLANILHNLDNDQLRFTRDLTAMEMLVEMHGLPPVVTMVLDQYPEYHGRGHRVAQLAETIAKLAGMDVIPTDDYYVMYSGQQLNVSPWEGHPNEAAHRMFAERFARILREHPVLQRYKQ